MTSVDVATKTLVTDFDKYQADGRQRHPAAEGRARRRAGRRRRPHRLVPGRSGDVRIEAAAEHPRHRRRRHCRRDAALGLGRAFAGENLRRGDRALLAGEKPARADADQLLLQPDRAGLRDLAARHYRPVDDQYAEVEGGAVISPLDAPRAARKAEAKQADAWFRTITGEVFG